MKKIFFSVVLIMLATWSMNAQKFGHMNFQAVLIEMPGMAEGTKELEALAINLRKQGDEMTAAVQEEYSAAQELVRNGVIAKNLQDKMAEEIFKKQQQVKMFDQNMGLQLQQKEAELLEPLINKLNDAITAVAKENDLLFIFDEGTQIFLFAEQSIDVTSKVQAKLGM